MSLFEEVIHVLNRHHVDYLIVGGWAAAIHGSLRSTVDIDVVYGRSTENLHKIVSALSHATPYLRGVPPGLPFRWDEATLRSGLNFTLTTRIGDIDLLGDVPGGGTYHDLLPHSIEVELFGMPCRVVTLECLIQLKRAAGRPKDLEAIAELQALLEERRKRER
jgi:hypothetical protein